jgi:hypothetical protein
MDFSQRVGSNTWFNVSANYISSEASREVGGIRSAGGVLSAITIPTDLSYRERTAQIGVNQLIGRDFAVGASYRISEAELDENAPTLTPAIAQKIGRLSHQASVLNQATLFGVINHPSGFFLRGETIWMHQSNREDVGSLVGDDFWHGNISAGYRFFRRRAEVALGILNVSDQDYRLHPLSLYSSIARERTFFVSFKFQF